MNSSWKESRPQIFDNICLYSEICYILSLSSVRIPAQRFLHDLFSDCQFHKVKSIGYWTREIRRMFDCFSYEKTAEISVFYSKMMKNMIVVIQVSEGNLETVTSVSNLVYSVFLLIRSCLFDVKYDFLFTGDDRRHGNTPPR